MFKTIRYSLFAHNSQNLATFYNQASQMPSTCSIRSLTKMSRRATSGPDHKTSFSRSNPRMRGQATSTRPSVRQRHKPSNNRQSLTGIEVALDPDQSSLHNTDKTGTHANRVVQTKTFQEDNLSLTRQRRSARAPNDRRRLTSLYRHHTQPLRGQPYSAVARRPRLAAPSAAKRSFRARQREDKTGQHERSEWWS